MTKTTDGASKIPTVLADAGSSDMARVCCTHCGSGTLKSSFVAVFPLYWRAMKGDFGWIVFACVCEGVEKHACIGYHFSFLFPPASVAFAHRSDLASIQLLSRSLPILLTRKPTH